LAANSAEIFFCCFLHSYDSPGAIPRFRKLGGPENKKGAIFLVGGGGARFINLLKIWLKNPATQGFSPF